ncbi:DNA methyltransferase [Alphaproteobacteria bacterium]|nr:DNA methyltransferase [Alphaproteobacteria bacterium]
MKSLPTSTADEISTADTKTTKNKKYDVIVADPPWDINQKGKYGASSHYNVENLDKIKSLPVKELAAEDCMLWIWVTKDILLQVDEILEAWGFDYNNFVVWVKDKVGLGKYVRNSAEICILATRGKPEVGFRSQPNWFYSPRQEHSHKPEEMFAITERVGRNLNDGDPRKLELFARRRQPGWDVWGNEIDSDICLAEYDWSVPSDTKFLEGGSR